MTKWGPLLCDMHRVEAQHLRGKLKIALQALEVLAQAGDETAQRALERIEGDD